METGRVPIDLEEEDTLIAVKHAAWVLARAFEAHYGYEPQSDMEIVPTEHGCTVVIEMVSKGRAH